MNIFRQNRILKGNVSIMVILILLACSLMGILTVVFLNSLITYTDDVYSYHKSYYIAKAGLELALTEIDNSAMGFSHTIGTGDFINENNFECPGCYFMSSIQGKSGIISNDFWENGECTAGNALVLQPGQSITIPMFYDKASGFNQIFSDENYIELLGEKRQQLSLDSKSNNGILNIGVIFQTGSLTGDLSWEYLYMAEKDIDDANFTSYFNGFRDEYGDTIWSYDEYYPYIILSNSNELPLSFCIKTSDGTTLRPTTKYFISSLGEYMGKTVGLQAIYAQPTPSFFINPYSIYGGGGGGAVQQDQFDY